MPRTPTARGAALVAASLTVALFGCTDSSSDAPLAPTVLAPVTAVAPPQQSIDGVITAQERHTAALMRIPGVVGTAVTRRANGQPAIQVFLERADVGGIPATLDNFPVDRLVTGLFHIISNPTTFVRPAPLGFSVGHPSITAGTIGFRVKNAGGSVFILSNNHVLANSNNASIGDLTLQPGPADGGSTGNSAHHIGTLADFQVINFSSSNNTMDAAISLVNPADLLGATPTDDGYGAPSATIWGDANNDGTFDNVANLLNVAVMKYGRTTEFTQGTITSVNATVAVCYAGFIFCTKSATFTNQLLVGQSGFSSGGDSGSGIVTVSGKNPVGLLFAGSASQTILNRIDLVLNRFNVTVDPTNDAPPPPDPVTDVAVDAVSTASPATEGSAQNVTVTVRNAGNTTVTTNFDVRLRDQTASATVGTQTVTTDLAPGATTNVMFSWTPAAPTGVNHTLEGAQLLADDDAANDTKTTTVLVNAPGGGGTPTSMHVAAMGGSSTNNGSTWTAHATITIRNDQGGLVSNATVSGNWSNGTTGSGSCLTNTSGVCTISRTGIPKRTGTVTFTVSGVTHATLTYNPGANATSSVVVSK
ncbi:MAG TPA: CARDB domain-containing protein [Gemmatimonadaceae bacterium]|nr:CARDB domain-containing protein [Gemmatimonadaceae bacterium]